MKKSISVLLIFCMLFTMLIIPVKADDTVYMGDTYYKFTFGEGGTAAKADKYLSGQTYTYKNNTFYPLLDLTVGSTKVTDATITDKATSSTVNTLRVEGSKSSRWKLIPLKSDGSPFEVAPNSSYTVKMKVYLEAKASGSQLFVGLAAPNTNDFNNATSAGWYNGNFVTSQVVHSPFLSGTMISGGQLVFEDFDSSRSSQYFYSTKPLATSDCAEYDAGNNSYTFVFETTVGNVENSNYFFISGYGTEFTVNGKSYSDTIHIAEIEITNDSVKNEEKYQHSCGFENTDAKNEHAFIDSTNNYIVSRVDRDYVKDGKLIMDEWFMSGRSGFNSANLSITNSGYNSTRSLKFKQISADINNSVAYKIADISDGMLLEDKASYRLSFYYKAEGTSNKDLTFSFVNAMNAENVAAVDGNNTVTIAKEDVKSEWTLVTINLTTDFDNISSEYSGDAFCIPAIVVNANINDTDRTVYMDSFAISKPLSKSLASVLVDTAAKTAGTQALRFYFNYNSDENGNIVFADGTKELSKRGILICASSKNEDLTIDNPNVIKREKSSQFDHCWNYDNGVMTFSAFITGFGDSDFRRVQVRGYVVLSDGTILYSEISEYSLDDIKGYNNLIKTKKNYSLDDSNVVSKIGFEGANEKLSAGYTFDWNGSAIVVTAKAVGKMTVYLSGNVANRKFTLYIDGKRISDKLTPVLSGEKYAVTFDVGNIPTVKEIRFVRQQEAYNGTAAILSFDMCGELMNTKEKDILIEYLGDSITSGMGVHSINNEDNDPLITDDGTNSYAFLSAQYLGVDYRIRSRIGIAVDRGFESTRKPGSSWLASYELENCWRDQTTAYSEERKADIVVIYLGTNDILANKTDNLTNSMKELITKVKSYNPDAKIVWISGGMRTECRPNIVEAINSFGGESAGYYICDMPKEFAHVDANNNYVNTGYHGHPGVEQQKVMAHTLIDFLNNKNLVN